MGIRLIIKNRNGLLLDDSITINASAMQLWQAETTFYRVLSELGFPQESTHLSALCEEDEFEGTEEEIPVKCLCTNTPLHHYSKAIVHVNYAS